MLSKAYGHSFFHSPFHFKSAPQSLDSAPLTMPLFLFFLSSFGMRSAKPRLDDGAADLEGRVVTAAAMPLH